MRCSRTRGSAPATRCTSGTTLRRSTCASSVPSSALSGALGRDNDDASTVEPLVLGRGADVDVVLSGDRVSRRHAEVRWTDDVVCGARPRFSQWCLGRRRGDRRVERRVTLEPGTPVRVGDVVFTVVACRGTQLRARDDAPPRHKLTSTTSDTSAALAGALRRARAREPSLSRPLRAERRRRSPLLPHPLRS